MIRLTIVSGIGTGMIDGESIYNLYFHRNTLRLMHVQSVVVQRLFVEIQTYTQSCDLTTLFIYYALQRGGAIGAGIYIMA